MSQNSIFLKTTLDMLENDPEIKSYIYQQIIDFNPFVTPETLVMVVARDPNALYLEGEEDDDEDKSEHFAISRAEEEENVSKSFQYRIAIVLKDGDSSIEAEAFDNDIFVAINQAKEKLVARLLEIQEEIESPQDRMAAIKDASENKQVH